MVLRENYPFTTANRAWIPRIGTVTRFLLLKAMTGVNAHCPPRAFALGVVVDNRDSTWHTKASGMLRCNVRSKSRWFIKFCNSYYIFAFCRVLHRCENQEVHRWKVYFVWCILHSSRWYPNPEVGVKKKRRKQAALRNSTSTNPKPKFWERPYPAQEPNRTNPV